MNKKKRIALIITIILVILAIIAGVTCAIVYGSNNHIYEEVVAEEYLASPATCTKKAVYYKSCECGKVSDETFEYGEPLGHDYGTLIAEDPATCTENGVKAHYHCTRCAKDFDESRQEATVEDLTIAAKGHDYGTWIDGKPATEDENGEKGHYHCPDCGKNFDNDDGKTEIEDIVIPPVVHVHTWGTVTYSWTGTTSCTATRVCVDDATHIETANATVTPQVMQNQTCELPELTTYTATFDEDWCVTQTLENVKTQEKLGHSYTNYVSDGNATCTEDGTKTATCDHTGCTETDTIADVDSKLGHSYTNYVSDGNATCTTDGTKTATCDHTGCTETDTIADVDSKLGHSFTTYTSNNDATCTKDGTKTAHCDHTGCTETDTITDVDSKLGHTFNQTVEDDKYKKSDATCTESAVYYKSCTCGEKGTDSDTFTSGTALGHTGGTATCAQKAMCTTCGQEYGELAAHSYAYTSVGDNTHKQTCSVCKTSTTPVKCSDADGDGYCDICGGLIYSEGLAYTLLSDDTYSLSGIGTCKDKALIVPATYNNLPVTAVSNDAFKSSRDGLTSILLPDSVTNIGEHAFQDNTKLTKINIPNKVTSIGKSAFFACTLLKDIVIPNSITKIEYCTFGYCSSLTSVTIPEGVTCIDICAFTNCSSLEGVVIPNSVTSIVEYAFCKCINLKTVYYKGTKDEWDNIRISTTENSTLINATRYYYSEGNPFEGDDAVTSGNFWHYVDGVVTVWKKEDE